jgi:hypothetical protein
MRRVVIAVVVLAVAGCGSQTRTVVLTAPQAGATSAASSKPTTTTSGTTSATTCPPGMATNENGELVYGSRGAYGRQCQKIAQRILARSSQAQARGEDSACGGKGPGACGQSGSSATTQSVQTQATPLPSCPNGYILTAPPTGYTCSLADPVVMVSCPGGQAETLDISPYGQATCSGGGKASCPHGYRPDPTSPEACDSTKPQHVPPTG